MSVVSYHGTIKAYVVAVVVFVSLVSYRVFGWAFVRFASRLLRVLVCVV